MLKPQKRDLTNEEKVSFQEFLRKNSGILFGEEVWKGLEYSIFQRMQEKALAQPLDYLNFLSFHQEGRSELIELLNLVTIKETHFFRTDTHFNALCEVILPELIDKRMKEWVKSSIKGTIRIWSAGCSTGEEPYTIALCVMKHIKTPDVIEILASDISSSALRVAHEGIFSRRSVKNVEKAMMSKYFIEEDNKYRIRDEIKDKVRFFQNNLIADRFPRHVDVIFCRNVTIYFNKETTREIIKKFHKSLNEGGYLLVGHSESLYGLGCESEFELVDLRDAFVYRKARAGHKSILKVRELPQKKTKLSDVLPRPTEKPKAHHVTPDVLFKEAKEHFEKKLYSNSLDICTKILSVNAKHEDALLLTGRIYADMNWHEDAVKMLTRLVEVNSLHLSGHFLLGLSLYKLGKPSEAEAEFKKALYLKPDFALAHFHLANILRENHKYAQAIKQYANALEAAAAFSEDSMDLTDGITKDVLKDACQLWIDTLKRRV